MPKQASSKLTDVELRKMTSIKPKSDVDLSEIQKLGISPTEALCGLANYFNRVLPDLACDEEDEMTERYGVIWQTLNS